ncbi:hypothetical protein G7016_24460 [Pseudomonas japonica]|nr:hypothetical protein [Pseudomonas japonica]
MILKAGEVIAVASGIYEGYDKAGPFIVARDFDLQAFVDQADAALSEELGVSGLMYEIPRMLLAQGFISVMPCRKIYLGGFREFELGEEKDDF